MKQKLLMLLCVLMSTVSAMAYDFEYTYNGKTLYFNKTSATTCEITSGSGAYSGDIVIPSSVSYNGTTYSVTSIGRSAFEGCSGLKSITIPNSIIWIGYTAFSGCWGLTSVTIPNSVTSIDTFAFQNCFGLKSIIVHSTKPTSVCLAYCVFDGVPTSTCVLYVPQGSMELYTAADQWKDFANIEEMVPQNSVGLCFEYTDDYTAYCVSGYTSDLPADVIIPEEYNGLPVVTIGARAFKGCSGLTSVTIPNSVTSIGAEAFLYCSSLTSVTIPNSVTSIGDYAFYDCSGLTSVTIPNSVTSIGYRAFSGCSGLTSFNGKFASDDHRCLVVDGVLISFAPAGLTSYNIPNSVTSIGDYAFSGCSGLTSVTIPNSVTSIENDAFLGCSGLTTVTFGNSVISIGSEAFAGCSSLSSVTIPNSVTSIGDYAFYDCSGLTSVTIPNSVTSIGEWVFNACSGLTSVTIPNSVTSIGSYAFSYCRGLEYITVDNDDPANISLDRNVFYNVPTSTCVLYVPRGSKELYAATDQWKDFANIVEMEAEEPDSRFAFAAEECDVRAGRVVTVPVSMVNEERVIGFQCDIELPEGMELALDEDDEYYIEDAGRFANHQVSANAIDGGVRFLVVSMNNKAFRGNEGVLFGIPVVATGDPRATEIRVHNIKLSDANSAQIDLPDLYIPVNVLPAYTPGDVNDDDAITVSDVTMTIAAALGNYLPGFVLEAADIDGNGTITVSDVTAIISMVLNQSNR